MKQISFTLILAIISFFVNGQDKVSTNTASSLKVFTLEEKNAIKKMVRLEGSKLIAQPGYRFNKVDRGTIVLADNSNGDVIGTFKCACTLNNGSCDVEISSGVNSCVAAKDSKCTTCEFSAKIFGKTSLVNAIF